MIKYKGKSGTISVAYFDKIGERNKIVYAICEKKLGKTYNEMLPAVLYSLTEYLPHCIDSPSQKLYINPSDLNRDDMVRSYEKHQTRMFHREKSFGEDLDMILSNIVHGFTNPRKPLVSLLHEQDETAILNIYKTIIQKGMANVGFSFQTLVVLDRIGGLSDKIINNPDHEDTPFSDLAKRINKLALVYDPDIRKYEKFILNYCSRRTDTNTI